MCRLAGVNEQTFTLETPSGRPVHGIVDLPEAAGPRPTVVIAHGFKGFLEWGFFPHLAELLRCRGFVVVRFNFWGTGMKPGDALVTDLDAFRANTFTADLEDLETVLTALTQEKLAAGHIDPKTLGLIGHSRGGGAVLLAAAKTPWNEAVRGLVTWNSIGRIDYVAPDRRESWKREGELEVINGRTGQRLMLGPELLAEIETLPPELDLHAAAARRTTPWLQLHGEKDEAIPLSEAEAMAQAATGSHQFQVIEGGSHTFGARHPFAGPTPHLIEALNATQRWFRRHLA